MDRAHLAVQARTAVDRASIGTLTTYARHPSASCATVVVVRARGDGSAEIELSRNAVAVAHLLARPLASLRVAPEACETVLLHGSACRQAGLSEQGLVRFRLQAAVVRVGSPSLLLDQAAYGAAEPDPLRHDAPRALAHLNAGHADALATCLRASGHDAAFARATRLDAGGLTVLAVHDGGVDTVRLRFPSPVRDLRELPPSLRAVLNPGCACGAPHQDGSSTSPRNP